MTLAPLVPMWLVVLVLALALIGVWRTYRSWPAAALLRLGVLAVVTLMLANPVREREQPVIRRPSLVVVVDSSISMATADGPAGATRFAQARAAATRLAAGLSETYTVTVLGFDEELRVLPNAPTKDTDFTGLTGLVAQAPKPAAVVFISDGADWRHGEPEADLARARMVVHTLGVGDQRPTTNISVRLEVASPTVFPGQELPITAYISASPDLRGQRVRLEVDTLNDGVADVALSRQEITLDTLVRVPLVDTPSGQKGGRLWRARIAPVAGEITEDDNQDFASAQVVDRSVRVLVVEGQPWWDTTFAVRAWRRDRQLDVATAMGMGKRTWRAGNAAPAKLDEAALKGVDVVVLGQQLDSLIGANGVAMLSKFVDQGGGLLLLGPGQRLGGALAELDPLAASGPLTPVEVTSEDAALPGLLSKDVRLPARRASGGALKPQSRILLGSREQPLIVSRHVGAGWVCSVNIEGIWSWHVGSQGREVGERFWRQLLRTLANAPMGNLRVERLRLAVGEELVAWVQPDQEQTEPVQLTLPDGTVQTLSLHDDTVRLRLERPGRYRLSRGKDSVTVVATVEVREKLEIARDDARLSRLAQATGGEAADITAVDRLADRLRVTRTLAGSIQRPEPMVTEPAWFLAVMVLVACEWWFRRRRGLV